MSDDMLNETAVNAIAGLALGGTAKTITLERDGKTVDVLARKDGDKIVVEGVKRFFDEWRTAPERREGIANVGDVHSFIYLVNRHKSTRSAIFGVMDRDGKYASLTAVIDYDDAAGDPAFQRHRIHYAFPFSREWMLLNARDNATMTQTDFAEFVEDNIHLMAVADGDELAAEKTFGTVFASPSDMLTLARGLSITAEASIKEIRDLRSGESEIMFTEAHRDAAGKPLHVPGLIMFKAPIFDGGPEKRFVARLRYRRSEGRLSWRYVLYRPIDAVRAAVDEDGWRAAKETDLPLFSGAPERSGVRM